MIVDYVLIGLLILLAPLVFICIRSRTAALLGALAVMLPGESSHRIGYGHGKERRARGSLQRKRKRRKMAQASRRRNRRRK